MLNFIQYCTIVFETAQLQFVKNIIYPDINAI
jgi:hypothetical protein